MWSTLVVFIRVKVCVVELACDNVFTYCHHFCGGYYNTLALLSISSKSFYYDQERYAA